MNQQNEKFDKEIETTKMWEILEFKITTELKNSMENLRSRLDPAEESSNDLEDKAFQIIHKSKKKKRRNPWDTMEKTTTKQNKNPNIHIMGIPEGGEKIFKAINGWKLCKPAKREKGIRIQET